MLLTHPGISQATTSDFSRAFPPLVDVAIGPISDYENFPMESVDDPQNSSTLDRISLQMNEQVEGEDPPFDPSDRPLTLEEWQALHDKLYRGLFARYNR